MMTQSLELYVHSTFGAEDILWQAFFKKKKKKIKSALLRLYKDTYLLPKIQNILANDDAIFASH